MTEQEIRDAILRVIEGGKPLQDGSALPWGLYPSHSYWREPGSRNEAHRLEFCAAVITRLKESQASSLDSPTALSLREHPFEVGQ